MRAHVSWISLTAVKALALQTVDEVDLLEQGLRGDRRFFLVDERDRLVNDKGSHGALQLVRGDYDEAADALTLSFPTGRELRGEIERGEKISTRFHTLDLPARLVRGEFGAALSEIAGESVRLVEPLFPAPDRLRGGAVSLLGDASLDALAGELGVDGVDPRRFRMNLGLAGLAPHDEDGWVGRRLSVGTAVLVPQGHVGRCSITTQNPETGKPDLDTLKALAAYRRDADATEPLPFGIYAAVAQPGRVRVGDPVVLAT